MSTNENQTTPPAVNNVSQSERFTNMVLKEFGSDVGTVDMTDYQRQLVQGYFIAIDRMLKTTEEEREIKNKKNTDNKQVNDLPYKWNNVNLPDLARDVVHYARMGLDMMQPNHLFPIPYKNSKTKKYDVTLMPGYNGIRYIAEKYAVDKPIAVTTELVYKTDTFIPIKKSAANKVESYEFAINNPFERGELIGGFGYIEYNDPTKNKLIIMSKKEILKRKPRYASQKFWGESEGWFEEMCLKTLKREVYSAKHMPRDPKKIDDNYQYLKMREAKIAEMEAQAEIDAYANADIIDTSEILQDEQENTVAEDEVTLGDSIPEPSEQPKDSEKPTF